MLPKLTARLVVRSVEVVWFWGALPLRWNKQSGRLEIIKTKWRQFLYIFNILVQLLNLSFLTFRYVQLYFRPSVPSTLKLYLEFVLLCYNYGVLYHTVLYLCLDDIVDFINGYRQLFTAMPRWLKTNLKVSRWCDILLAQLMIFGHLALSMNLVTLLRRPQNLVYFTSLLDNPQGLGLVGKMPFSAVYVYIWWSMWSLIHFIRIQTMAYVYAQDGVLKYLLQAGKGTEERFMQNSQRLASLYRTLQVLQVKFDNGLGVIQGPYKLTATFLIIRGIYSGLMEKGSMSILCCFTGLMAWATLHASLTVFGQVYEDSQEVLSAMKLKNRDPWFRRFHKSCRPLKIRVSKLYFCDRGLPLSLAAFIFDSIVGLLVASST